MKKYNSLTFSISDLVDANTGKKISYSFEGPVDFEGISVKSEAKGKVEIMRLKNSLHVKVEDFSVEAGFICVKCLKEFTKKIKVPFTEREFLFEMPKKPEDPNDLFLIDTKRQKIHMDEPIRQEIILHFPSIPLCYTGCKGICPVCGGDKNKKSCACKVEKNSENKPLSALKDLLKQ